MMATPQPSTARRERLYAWAVVIGLCVAIILWGLLHYALIRDRVRAWDFGALPDVPSESVYSSAKPPAGQPAPRQIAPLPEATPATPVPAQERQP